MYLSSKCRVFMKISTFLCFLILVMGLFQIFECNNIAQMNITEDSRSAEEIIIEHIRLMKLKKSIFYRNLFTNQIFSYGRLK